MATAGVLTALVWAPNAAVADIYKRVGADGTIHFTDRPVGDGWQLLLRTRKGWSPNVLLRPLRRTRSDFDASIREASQRWGVNEALIHAVVRAESAYDPDAVSRAGAVGLMQLMPDTAKRYGVYDRRDPHANIEGGTRYLRDLLDRFQNLRLALAAYNAGEGAVERHGRQIPPYEETQNYVAKVLQLFRQNLGHDVPTG